MIANTSFCTACAFLIFCHKPRKSSGKVYTISPPAPRANLTHNSVSSREEHSLRRFDSLKRFLVEMHSIFSKSPNFRFSALFNTLSAVIIHAFFFCFSSSLAFRLSLPMSSTFCSMWVYFGFELCLTFSRFGDMTAVKWRTGGTGVGLEFSFRAGCFLLFSPFPLPSHFSLSRSCPLLKTAAAQANSHSRVNVLSIRTKQPPPLRPLLFCTARSILDFVIKTKIQN